MEALTGWRARTATITRAALVIAGLMVAWLDPFVAEAGNRNGACGGPLQRHCCTIPPETSNLQACDSGLVSIIGGPGAGQGPPIFPFGPACSLGTCYSTAFPAACGGRDEPACTLNQHYQECQSGFRNSGGSCRHPDDLFPAGCGHESQAACSVIVQVALGINSCQSAFTEMPFPGGTCVRLDGNGFPPSCGHLDQPACTIDVQAQLGIVSCSGSLAEVPFPGGQCIELDSDGFPSFCGGANERPCRLNEHFSGSCKPLLTETLILQDGQLELLCVDAFPADCGGNGQRPCSIFEHLAGPCRSGLSIRNEDFGECGANPMSWPPSEVPRGGPRTVFFIHGRGGDYSELHKLVGELPHQLKFQVPNIREVYGLDWNAKYSVPRKVMARELVTDPDSAAFCDRDAHTCEFVPTQDTNGDGLVNEEDADDPSTGKCSGGPRGAKECTTDGACRNLCQGGANPAESCAVTPCNVAVTDRGTFGDMEFDTTDFEIWEVARGMSEAIKAMPSTPDITIVAGSFGGVIARQLVYRHYDELRQAGKRIAEVVTLAVPHQGGQAATPDIPRGAELQNYYACFAGQEFNPSNHLGCEIGRWIEWSQKKAAGEIAPFTPLHIDDRNFPQVRWIVAAAGGRTLDLTQNIAAVQAVFGGLAGDFVSLMQSLQDPSQNFHDSDGTITVRSAFGIQPDECYPFTREPAPSGGAGPEIVNTTHAYNVMHYDENGDGAFTEADAPIGTCRRTVPVQPVYQTFAAASAVCHHPGARVDPRVTERDELTCLNHSDFGGTNSPRAAADVNQFVIASLTLEGDVNGDGVVNEHDHPITPDAGPDQTLECTGPATAVVLNGSGSAHLLARPLTYTWSGGFGAATGVAPTIALPVGIHSISLSVGDGTGATETDGVAVMVQDTMPPTVGGASGFLLEATSVSGTPFAFSPEAIDLCGPVTFQVSPALSLFPLGSTGLTVTATDASGNASSQMVTVTVVDTTPPEITAPPAVNAEATAILSVVEIGGPTATDIFAVTVGNDAPTAFPLGATRVTWTGTDPSGNAASAVQTVTVVDTTLPALTLPPDVVVPATGGLTPVDIGTATATDIFGATVSHDGPASFPVGLTLVTWTAADLNGNRASATQRVQVVYRFDGFSGPVQAGGVYKANRTLPLKFRLSFADGAPVATALARLSVVFLGPGAATGDPLDVDSSDGPDGDLFRYTGDQYHLNVKTSGWNPGWYRLSVALDDGRAFAMDIALR